MVGILAERGFSEIVVDAYVGDFIRGLARRHIHSEK